MSLLFNFISHAEDACLNPVCVNRPLQLINNVAIAAYASDVLCLKIDASLRRLVGFDAGLPVFRLIWWYDRVTETRQTQSQRITAELIEQPLFLWFYRIANFEIFDMDLPENR